MEIARRVAVPAQRRELVIKSTTGAAEYLRERMCGLSEEQFRVLYLNRRHALLEDALIAQGSVESVRPPLRTIVARALQVNASALIAAHNHPSGVPEASESDRLLTQAISGKDSTSSIPSPLTGEGEGGGAREAQGTDRRP